MKVESEAPIVYSRVGGVIPSNSTALAIPTRMSSSLSSFLASHWRRDVTPGRHFVLQVICIRT